jgi:hypothetical protein
MWPRIRADRLQSLPPAFDWDKKKTTTTSSSHSGELAKMMPIKHDMPLERVCNAHSVTTTQNDTQKHALELISQIKM